MGRGILEFWNSVAFEALYGPLRPVWVLAPSSPRGAAFVSAPRIWDFPGSARPQRRRRYQKLAFSEFLAAKLTSRCCHRGFLTLQSVAQQAQGEIWGVRVLEKRPHWLGSGDGSRSEVSEATGPRSPVRAGLWRRRRACAGFPTTSFSRLLGNRVNSPLSLS